MGLLVDLNNAPIPVGWRLTGVTPAVDNPKARWMMKEGHARLVFDLDAAQPINVYVVVAYPYRLQTLQVALNGRPIISGQSHEAWYKQFLSVDVPAQAGQNVLDLYGGGPSGQPEGYLRLNQLQLRRVETDNDLATGPIEILSGLLFLVIVILVAKNGRNSRSW